VVGADGDEAGDMVDSVETDNVDSAHDHDGGTADSSAVQMVMMRENAASPP
jgi:hypothetical protein